MFIWSVLSISYLLNYYDFLSAFFNRSFQVFHVHVLHVIENDAVPIVGALCAEVDVAQVESVHVAGIESVGRCWSGPSRLGIVGALFAVGLVLQVGGAATPILHLYVLQGYVVQGCALHASDDDARQAVAVLGYDVAHHDVAAIAGLFHVLWSAVAATGGDVDGIVVHVHHGEVTGHDVFHASLVHFFKSET